MESFNTKWLVLFGGQLAMIVFLIVVLMFAPGGSLSLDFRGGLESTVLLLIGGSVMQGATYNMTAKK